MLSIPVVVDDAAVRSLIAIALIDIGLPDGDGLFLTRQLCARPWPMRIVTFSSDAGRTNADAALRAGAVGFCPKDELSSPALERLIGMQTNEDR